MSRSHVVPVGPAVAAAAWLVVIGIAAAGGWSLSLIDAIVLLGVAVVLPLTMGTTRWWALAAIGAFVSFLVPRGLAVVFVVPLLGVSVATTVQRVRRLGPMLFWNSGPVLDAIIAAYAVVAAGALAQSRAGGELFGVREPIVELTAVHYMFAGCAALFLARATAASASGRTRRVSQAATIATAAAPPVVAIGFATASALPQVGGAILMASGVCLTASLHVGSAVRRGPGLERALLAVSGVAVWAPMVLAVAWAAGQHWNLPILSVKDMARTHGLVNALAFTLCGLIARRLPEAKPARTHAEVMS